MGTHETARDPANTSVNFRHTYTSGKLPWFSAAGVAVAVWDFIPMMNMAMKF